MTAHFDTPFLTAIVPGHRTLGGGAASAANTESAFARRDPR